MSGEFRIPIPVQTLSAEEALDGIRFWHAARDQIRNFHFATMLRFIARRVTDGSHSPLLLLS